MRISDWSSDVCLPICPSTQRRKSRAANRMSAAPKLPADSVNLIIPDLLPACVTALKAAEQLLGTATAAVAQLVRGVDGRIDAARLEEEIGRASCRERGCQYV